MWNIRILDFDIFFIAYSFFIYSFAGWIWETCFCSYNRKTFVNRGFLNGPIIPIYGIGGTLVYITLYQFSSNAAAVFLFGTMMATALEYFTGVIMENAFRAKWWDYSDCKVNFQGRICLKASLLWGVFSIVDVNALGPMVREIILKIPRRQGEIACAVFLIIAIVDFIVTVISTVQLSESVRHLSKLREELMTYLLSTRMIEKSSDLKEAFYTSTISKLVQKKDTVLNLLTIRFRDSIAKEESTEEVERRVTRFRDELDKRFHLFATKYKISSHKNNLIHKRLIKAFPDLTFTRGRYYLQELKEKFNSHNTKKE